MYASENFSQSNLVLFPGSNRTQPSSEKIVYFCQLTKISRKYFSQIEQEFQHLAQLFSFEFVKVGSTGYETISILSAETPLISYQICSEAIIGTTDIKQLDILDRAVQKEPKVFNSNSIIAFLIRAIKSPIFLEKE